MESVHTSEVNKIPRSSSEEEINEFAPFMEGEDKEEDATEAELMDGPVIAPLVPVIQKFETILISIPEEIRPLIEPLPMEIKTFFKKGIEQTKLVIELSSTERVEIVIDRYDTDPTTFHISFYSSEQTGAMIAEKQSLLMKALQTALPKFAFAISPPYGFSLPKTGAFRYSPIKQRKRGK